MVTVCGSPVPGEVERAARRPAGRRRAARTRPRGDRGGSRSGSRRTPRSGRTTPPHRAGRHGCGPRARPAARRRCRPRRRRSPRFSCVGQPEHGRRGIGLGRPGGRRARPASTSGSWEPLSPRVQTTSATSAPSSAHRASVPAHETSGSSGWAYTASTRSGVPPAGGAGLATSRTVPGGRGPGPRWGVADHPAIRPAPTLADLAEQAARAAADAPGRRRWIGPRPRCPPSRRAPTWSPRWTAPPSGSSSDSCSARGPTTGCSARREPIGPASSGVRWIIDPLDGTTNYVYRHPGVSVSIAAEVARGGRRRRGRRRARPAIASGPSAASGATRNGAADPRVRPRPTWPGRSSPPASATRPTSAATRARCSAASWADIRDIRRMGSAALDLCSVACGRVDAYYELSLSPWDFAAGALIAAEAGAVVIDLDGDQPRAAPLLAANPALAESLRPAAPAGARPDAIGVRRRRGRRRPCETRSVSARTRRKSGTMGRWEPESWPSRTTSASAPRSSSPSRTRAGRSRRPTTARTRSTRSAGTRPTSC